MASGNSVVSIRLDVEDFQQDLERLQRAYEDTYKAMEGEASRLNDAYKERIRIQNEIAKTQTKLAKSSRGTAEYKALQKQLKELRVAYKAIQAEETAASRNKAALTRQLKQYERQIRATKSAMDGLRESEEKNNRNRRNSLNDLIRGIRQLESFAVAFGSLKLLYNNVISEGIKYNQLVEDQMIGLQSLISQTYDYVDVNGKVVDGYKAYELAAEDARRGFEIVREINVETTHSLSETLQIYKLLVPQLLKYGATMEDVGEITKNVSLLASQRGVEFQEILKVIDSLTSGQMLDSGLKRVLESVGITNEAIRELKRNGGDLIGFFKKNLEGVKYASEDFQKSFTGLANQLRNIYAEIRGQVTEGIFDFLKDYMTDLKVNLKENKDLFVEFGKVIVYVTAPLAALTLGVGALGVVIRTANFAFAPFVELLGHAKKGIIALSAPILVAVGAYEGLKYAVEEAAASVDEMRTKFTAVRKTQTMIEEVDRLTARYKKLKKELEEGPSLWDTMFGKGGGANRKAQIEQEMKKIENDLRALGASYNRVQIKTPKPRPKKDTASDQSDAKVKKLSTSVEDLTARLRMAREEYRALMNGDDAQTIQVQRAVMEYEAAIERINKLSSKLGDESVDQDSLKEKLLRAQVDAQTRLNDLVKLGNDLNAQGLVTIEQQAKARQRMREDALAAYEKLKSENIEGYAANEEVLNNYRLLVGLYESGIIPSAEEYNAILESINQKTVEAFEKVEEGGDKWKDQIAQINNKITGELEKGMTDVFRSWMNGALDFGDMMKRMIDEIVVEMMRLLVIKPLVDSLSIGIGSFVPFARGGVVQAFANGGVVSQPTVFPMANGMGLMGEAGPEAVMPLTRTSNGDLGVKGTTGDVIINVENQTGLPIDMEKLSQSIQDDGTRIVNVVMKAAETNPEFRRVMGIGGY